jgi:pheromone shutdown protein TraB
MRTIFEIDLVRLAKWHKACTYTILIIIVFWIAFVIFRFYGRPIPGIEVIATIFYLATILVTSVLSGLTQRAMGHNLFTAIVWALASLLLSFLVLLSTASTAGMILKLAGAKTGTLGVGKSDLDRLRQNHCRACGYSREGIGLLDPCPECTRVPQVI